jgi:hypothetical protein
MTSNPEERDTLPLHSMAYDEQYRSHDRWDRVLRFPARRRGARREGHTMSLDRPDGLQR